MRVPLLAALVTSVVVAGCAARADDQEGAASDLAVSATTTAGEVSVHGNQLVNDAGHNTRLLGVNYVGTEYQCVNGQGIFDQPDEAKVIAAMVRWKIDTVRIPLNEQCWLGIGNIDARFSGTAYRSAVTDFVGRLRARGMTIILTVQWSSSIPGRATRQQPLLDRQNGLPFWRSVSTTFGADRGVVFDLYSEPFLDTTNTNHAYKDDTWQCLLRGCTVTHDNETYEAAGSQAIVDEIRSTGAKNVLLVPGLGYSNDLSTLQAHLPVDPLRSLAASFHTYPVTNCRSRECWDRVLGKLAETIPVVAGEIGEYDCAGTFITDYMAWADARGMSYLGWAFNTGDCDKRPSMLADWEGTPTAFGTVFRDHLATQKKQ